jgi:chromosome partition protein MukE
MMEHDLQSGLDEQRAASGGDGPPDIPLVSGYQRLEDAILDDCFPEVDLALRRGRHIHKGDERWFRFLSEAQPLLEPFYQRYGCELAQRSDGYFFLLPVSDGLGKRHLGVPEMIVGQGLALCYLDPQSVQSGGVVTREELLNQLAAVMGTDALMHTLNPKRKRVDERVMQRTVRQKVNEALRRLSLLGFVELIDAEQLRLAPSLMRFAEPVRGLDAPSEALKRLIERGEVSLGPGDSEPQDADADEGEELDAAEDDAAMSPGDAAGSDDAIGNDAMGDDADAAPSADRLAVDAPDDLAAEGHGPDDHGPNDLAADGLALQDLGVDRAQAAASRQDDASDESETHGPPPVDPESERLEPSAQRPLEPEPTPGDGALRPPDEASGSRAELESPPRTYEGFPANDREHPDDDDGVSPGEAGYAGDEPARPDADGGDSAAEARWADEAAHAATERESPAPEHVEIDFDWDTLPDEEA